MLRITTYDTGDWRSISVEDFEARLLEICDAHRAQGRALAFAFILFDRSHPFVREALTHEQYWQALDQRSGRHLSVFSVDVRSHIEQPNVEGDGNDAVASPSFDRVQQGLSKYFENADDLSVPCVLFFQVKDRKVVDSLAVKITGNGLRETYKELDSVIGTAADSISRVRDENAGNAHEIFNLIAQALEKKRRIKRLMRVYRLARPVAEVGGAVQVLQWLFRVAAN